MRIVSQSGKISVEFDNVAISCESGIIIAEPYISKRNWTLGEYKSNERALEVMEQIHKAYAVSICNTLRADDDSSLDDISQFMGMNEIVKAKATFECLSPMISSENAVFYMPKE